MFLSSSAERNATLLVFAGTSLVPNVIRDLNKSVKFRSLDVIMSALMCHVISEIKVQLTVYYHFNFKNSITGMFTFFHYIVELFFSPSIVQLNK